MNKRNLWKKFGVMACIKSARILLNKLSTPMIEDVLTHIFLEYTKRVQWNLSVLVVISAAECSGITNEPDASRLGFVSRAVALLMSTLMAKSIEGSTNRSIYSDAVIVFSLRKLPQTTTGDFQTSPFDQWCLGMAQYFYPTINLILLE